METEVWGWACLSLHCAQETGQVLVPEEGSGERWGAPGFGGGYGATSRDRGGRAGGEHAVGCACLGTEKDQLLQWAVDIYPLNMSLRHHGNLLVTRTIPHICPAPGISHCAVSGVDSSRCPVNIAGADSVIVPSCSGRN